MKKILRFVAAVLESKGCGTEARHSHPFVLVISPQFVPQWNDEWNLAAFDLLAALMLLLWYVSARGMSRGLVLSAKINIAGFENISGFIRAWGVNAKSVVAHVSRV